MIDIQIIPIAQADVVSLMKNVDRVIINPIIFFLFAAAMVYFLYGLVQYLISPDNEEIRKTSKSHMLYGVFGLFIMVAVFGIERLILNTAGVTNVKIQNNGDYEIVKKSTDINGVTTDNGSTLMEGANSAQQKLNEALVCPIDDYSPVCGVDGQTYNNECLATKANVTVKSDGACAPGTTAGDVSHQMTKSTEAVNGDYTKSPFAGPPYTSDSLCWRKAVSANATTEYKALQQVKEIARSNLLADLGVPDSKVSASYPFPLETATLYDKVNKLYYVWWAAAAPIGVGTTADCKRVVEATGVLPKIVDESTKTSQLIGKYSTDDAYYRVVDSGTSPVMQTARSIAITNALVRVAVEKQITSIKNIQYVIIDESYFPPDVNTGNYDYFVVIRVAR